MTESGSMFLQEMCLQLTNACPLRCAHCSTRGGVPYSDELSTAEIVTLLSDFSDLGGRVLELSGGEPLVHPLIVQIARVGRSLGLEVRLYSSGAVGYSDGAAVASRPSQWTS